MHNGIMAREKKTLFLRLCHHIVRWRNVGGASVQSDSSMGKDRHSNATSSAPRGRGGVDLRTGGTMEKRSWQAKRIDRDTVGVTVVR